MLCGWRTRKGYGFAECVAGMTRAARQSEVPVKKGKPSRTAQAVVSRAGQGARAPETVAVAAAPARPAQPSQPELFEQAVALFHARDFRKALQLFQRSAEGPNLEMAHSARLHARMCEQRIDQGAPQLGTAEDYYNYAIALINRRQLPEAERQLQEALRLAPGADHLYYALALCRGLQGDFAAARAHLKRAIEIEPRNRILARNDPDFRELAAEPPLRELLFPERIASL